MDESVIQCWVCLFYLHIANKKSHRVSFTATSFPMGDLNDGIRTAHRTWAICLVSDNRSRHVTYCNKFARLHAWHHLTNSHCIHSLRMAELDLIPQLCPRARITLCSLFVSRETPKLYVLNSPCTYNGTSFAWRTWRDNTWSKIGDVLILLLQGLLFYSWTS